MKNQIKDEIMVKFKKLTEFLKTIINSKEDFLPVAGALYLCYEALKEEIEQKNK